MQRARLLAGQIVGEVLKESELKIEETDEASEDAAVKPDGE